MKNHLFALLALVLLLASCAGIPGPLVSFGFGPLLDQLVPLLVICGAVALAWKFGLAWLRHPENAGKADNGEKSTPESTVCLRYARGDITRDQFLQTLEDLGRKR